MYQKLFQTIKWAEWSRVFVDSAIACTDGVWALLVAHHFYVWRVRAANWVRGHTYTEYGLQQCGITEHHPLLNIITYLYAWLVDTLICESMMMLMVLAKNRKGILFPCRTSAEWRFMLLFFFYIFHFFIIFLSTWCVFRVFFDFNKSFSMFDVFPSNFFSTPILLSLLVLFLFFFFVVTLFCALSFVCLIIFLAKNEWKWNIISIFGRKWRMEMRMS